MNYRKLGKTGLMVSEIGFGPEWMTGTPEETRAIAEVLREAGVNYLDCWMPDPHIRANLGYAMKGHTDEWIVQGHIGACWVDGQYLRSRDVALAQPAFEDELTLLGVDHFEVGMMHYIDSVDEFRACLDGPYYEYVQELLRAGTIRHVGLSTHNPEVALEAARREVVEVIMFAKFVDMTDDADLIEGLACGPASLDGFADLARTLPAYEQAMQRLDAYSEEEAAVALERVAAAIDTLVLLDEVEGFAGVEAAMDAFFGWWSEFVVPTEELGYLGFWAIFEDQSLVAEYVETIGGTGDAATLQMLAFFVMLARFMKANDALICEIAQLVDSDVVAAIDLAYDLIAAAGVGWLGTKGAREVPGDTLAALCFSLLVFADRALEDEWLRAYLGLEGTISYDSEALASTLRVIDVMCGE